MTATDHLYQNPLSPVPPFAFNQAVADVFDDMAARSIPGYMTIQTMIVALCDRLVPPNGCITDIGCSTGTTLAQLAALSQSRPCQLMGIDASESMIKKARHKCQNLLNTGQLTLQKATLSNTLNLPKSDVIILNLVLQFIDPSHRHSVLSHIKRALNPNGWLILIEKTTPRHHVSLWDQLYTTYKTANHYSAIEIEQKKTALQECLRPLSLSENLTLLRESGFSESETFFQYYHFVGYLACAKK